MFDALAVADAVAWDRVDVLQVDERIAPDGHEDRNETALRARLLDHVPATYAGLAVTLDPPADGATRSAEQLRSVAGHPPTIDVVHLGIGDDGHTASLVPGDPLLDEVDPPTVAVSREYRGRRRLTLTAPTIRRAGLQVWLVCGAGKREAAAAMLAGDPSVPASTVIVPGAVVVLDRAADPR